jgi:hypothetical protein
VRGQNRFATGAAAGALAAFVGFSFTSLFHYSLGEEPLALITFFYFGVAVAMDRMTTTPGAMDIS